MRVHMCEWDECSRFAMWKRKDTLCSLGNVCGIKNTRRNSMSMSMSYTLLNKKFSEECVGLCEEMGLQPITELFTTDGGWAQVCRQWVPDNGGCNMEAPLAEPGPGPRNQHVTAFSRTDVCPPRDVSERHTDVHEIGWKLNWEQMLM